VLGADGEISLWAGVVTEIEQQKRAELALDRREREFRTLVENSPDGVARVDRQLRFVYANEACLGQSSKQLVGRTFEEARLPDVAAVALRTAALRALARNQAQQCDFALNAHERERYYVCRLIPEADRLGHVESVLCVFYDVTRQQVALEALQESEHRFAQFASSSDDVFWIADAESGALLYVSPAFEQLWGVSVEALKADPLKWNQGVITPAPVVLPQPFYQPMATAGGKEPVREYRVRRPDGTPVWVRDRRFHLHTTAQGQVTCVGGIVEDITERKVWDTGCEVVLALEREARHEAEAQASAKDEFLAIVSHELRSPLNAIRGWAHVLRQTGELTHSQLRMLDAIDRNTQAQAQLVDDMLDTQRLLRGKIKLELKPAALAPLIEQAVDTVRPSAAAKQIALQVRHDTSIDGVQADPDRLRQALVNLLSNAVKFTPEQGHVEVSSGRRDGIVLISVHDTGIGIEPSLLPRIFDPFRQAADASTRRQSGLGLGLALARQLVELHGGSLKARSAGTGQGATFTIELPTRRHGSATHSTASADKSADERLAVQHLEGCRIAIVDDDVEARQILELLLGRHHARTVAFSSVAAVYAYLETVAAEHRPQVLISDIAMPDEDGYSLLRRVRSLERRHAERSTMICVALTAFVTEKDRERALAAGFDEHLGKPVDPQQLVIVVNKLLQARVSDAPP
jgi:PAS domain S-box-containing protein